ncbi:MAG: response regulator [Cyanothece sp. SIO1E1]|nr:response regulator [Cyanothece sp. SIO1E1]
MDNALLTSDGISRKLMGQKQLQKPRMLIVDDEPDNLELLYRTFRREYQVLRAESGTAALEKLATEGEVAVIISDQRMPEMKGTEFLSKTIPQFPNTMRIILTGFTDVRDLVEAINAGQVYKYITKPWDPHELKRVVEHAVGNYESLKQQTEELQLAESQTELLKIIIQATQQSFSIENCLQSIATVFGKNFSVDGCILQLIENDALATQAFYSATESLRQWLQPASLVTEPLTQAAIASQQVQSTDNSFNDERLSQTSYYSNTGVQTHLVVPIAFKNQMLAILSLQWQQAHMLRQDKLQLIQLAAQQVGLALTCMGTQYAMA